MSIKLLDIYSKPIGFLFHNKFNFRTSIRGILRLLIVGLLALLFYNFIKNMIDRSLPTIFTDIDDNFKREINLLMKKPFFSENSTNQDYNLPEERKYNSVSAYFSLLIRNTSSNKVIPIDQSYFTIEGYFIVSEKNKLSNVTKLDSLFCNGYGPVSSSEFEYMMLNTSYCFYGDELKLSNFKLVNEKKGFLQMTIRKCGTETSQLSNNTNNNTNNIVKCKSNAEINSILRSLSFELIYLSTSINSTNYENPISFQIETRFYNPIVDYYKEMYLNIEVNKLESYNLFLPSYLQRPTVEYVFSEIVESSSSVKNSTLRQVNNGKIIDVIISSSTLKRTYRRYYLNIIDIIASIGGSFYVIYALFYIILISYIDLRYIEKLVNSFYKIINPKYDNIVSLSFEKFLHFHYNRLMNLFITKNKKRIISFLKTKNMFHQLADSNNKPLTDNLTNKIKESKKSLPIQVGNPNVEIHSIDLGNTENLMDVSDYNHLEMYFTLNRIENIFGFNFENRLNEIYNIAKNPDRVEYYSNPLEPQKKMSCMKKTYENNGDNINPLDDYINKRNEKEEGKKTQNGLILDTKTRISHLKNLSIMSREGKEEKDEKEGKDGNEISNDNNIYFEEKDIVNNENHILIDENNIENIYRKLQYIDYYNYFFSDKPSNIIYHKTKMIYNLLKYECFNGLYFSTIEIVTLIFCGCFFKKRKNKNEFSEKEQNKSKPSQKQVEMENKPETNRESREGNKDKEIELRNNENKSFLLKKLKLKENIKKGKFDDETILNGSSVSYIEGLNNKKLLIEKTSNDLKINFDITNILSSISDFENFKKCYFNKNQVFLFNSISSPLITYDSEVKDHEIDTSDYEKIEDLNKILDEIITRGEILPIEYSLIMVMGGSKELVNEFMNEVVSHFINLNEELKKKEYLNTQSIDDQESKKKKDNDYEVYDSDQSYVISSSNKDDNNKNQVKSKKKLKSKKTKKENEKIIDEEDFINQMERFNLASNQKKMATTKSLYENKENLKDDENANQKSENMIPKYVDEIEGQSEQEEKKVYEKSHSNSNNKSNSLFKLHHSFDEDDEKDEDENEEVLDEKEEYPKKEEKKENEFNSKLKLKVNKKELFKNNYDSDDSNDRGYAL